MLPTTTPTNVFFYVRDAVTVVLCDVIISLLSGFVAFAVIGNMAHELNIPFPKAVHSVHSLAFIAYPEAVSQLSISPLWSFLFFAMLFCLGLDSQYTAVESIRSTFEDAWPRLRKHRACFLLIVCTSCFFFGLPMITKAGILVFSIFDEYAVSWSVLAVGILNCLVVTWFYGYLSKKNLSEFRKHVEGMIMGVMSHYWMICWEFLTPTLLFALLILDLTVRLAKQEQYGDYSFPLWADVSGWILSSIPILVVLLCAIREVVCILFKKKPVSDVIHSLSGWGPSSDFSEP